MEEIHNISRPEELHPLKKMFVTDTIAKLLKEKGFDEPCFAYYQLSHTGDDYKFYMVGERGKSGYNDWYVNYVGFGLSNSEMQRNPIGRLKQCFTAPMYQQVQDWLRTKHNIMLDIRYMPKIKAWINHAYNANEEEYWSISAPITDYDIAQEQILLKVLTLIK